MREVTLSDHTKHKVQEATCARKRAYDEAVRGRESAVVRRDGERAKRKESIHEAWRTHQWLSWMGAHWAHLFGKYTSVPPAPQMAAASREEVVWTAGREGEQKVRNVLAARLGDDWILISGYRNAKGEIDQVLVGPAGVFAIEIKFVNGVVHCLGDRWWRDKYDRFGNCVETGLPITDKKGRSPSQQINESVDLLQGFLDRQFGPGRVRRAVILSHDSSRIGRTEGITVDHVSTLAAWNLTEFLIPLGSSLSDQQASEVVEAIRRDHSYFARKLAA